MKKKYCCNSQLYKDYYKNQAGSGISGFHGSRYQHGSGLGSLFSGVLRAAAPLLKKGAIALGKQALRTGVNLASNYLNEPRKPINRGVKRKRVIYKKAKQRRTSKDIFN